MVRVFLIRHGQSESNAGLPTAEAASIALTATGREQAQRVALALAEAPALIVTSPYLRARQTAEPTIARYPAAACQQWPVQEFTYLGELHGRTTTSAERRPYREAYWERADPYAAVNGAESFASLLGRATDFLDRISAAGSGPVAVFTHAMFIRAVAWFLLTGVSSPGHPGPGPDADAGHPGLGHPGPDAGQMRGFHRFADRFGVPNASITELRHTDGDALVLSGGTTHLPAALA
jgi:2,3-bisphosphoglycerate-dependent phosphoglycerate mutase